MRIAGIDPGRHGALVNLDIAHDGARIYKLAYDKSKHLLAIELWEMLNAFSPDVIVIEKVGGRGGMGATSTFNFGFGCGELNAVLGLWTRQTGAAMQYVQPQAWQRVIHEGVDAKLDAKARSLIAYERLYPHKPIPAGPKGGKIDDNLVDALLLATYGVLKLGGGKLRRWKF